MKNFIKKLKNKFIKTRISPVTSKENGLMSKFSGKNFKNIFTSRDSLSFSAKQTFIKEEINAEARSILKKAVNNPEALVSFVKSKATIVAKSRYMQPALFIFGEQTGFIPPLKGFKAFWLSIILNIISKAKLNIGFETPALFALDNKPVNIYFLSHQFHLWLSYVNELPGFDETTRKNFKNVWDSNVDSMEVSKLSMEEILSLKDAIARDLEAIKFVKEMAREFVGQKQSLQKIKEGKSTNI